MLRDILFFSIARDLIRYKSIVSRMYASKFVLTCWGRKKWPPIERHYQIIFFNEIIVFWFEFHRNLFTTVQWTKWPNCSRRWVGADQATNHYSNHWCHSSLTHICIDEVKPVGEDNLTDKSRIRNKIIMNLINLYNKSYVPDYQECKNRKWVQMRPSICAFVSLF